MPETPRVGSPVWIEIYVASEWEAGVPPLNYISGMGDQEKGWDAEMFSRMMVKEYQLKTTP